MRSYNAIGSEIHEGKFENMRMTVVFIDYLFVLEIFIFSEWNLNFFLILENYAALYGHIL